MKIQPVEAKTTYANRHEKATKSAFKTMRTRLEEHFQYLFKQVV